jgi:hypothetical protein
MAKKTKPSTTKAANRPVSSSVSGTTGAMLTPVVSGSIAAGMPPVGLFASSLALEADTSQEFADLAPTFGDVLLSVGNGVASSQDSLDRGLVETAKDLSNTKITVVSDVIQKLDEDGLPVAADTELVSKEVSLINYVNPTVHEWSHVALSMDLSVGAMDNERGVQFSREQSRGSVGGSGLFWGFLGWFKTKESTQDSSYTSQIDQEADWARGQVRLDAQLRPRDVGRFPTPAEVSIGPQIYFSQGSVRETIAGGVVTARELTLEIIVRKADGSVNPSVTIDLDSGAFRQSFKSDEGYTGATTNADGRCQVTLTRDIPNARFLGAMKSNVKVALGDITKVTEITL